MADRVIAPLILTVFIGSILTGAAAASAQWSNALKPTGEPGPELTLAADGKTDYRIVVPIKPTTQDAKAAEELARWLKEMTGAEFPVVQETPDFLSVGRDISIGRTMLLHAAQLPEADADLGDEGYAIAVRDKMLFLFGGKQRGAISAVIALLEEDLGARAQFIRREKDIERRTVLDLYEMFAGRAEDQRDIVSRRLLESRRQVFDCVTKVRREPRRVSRPRSRGKSRRSTR